MSLSDTKKKIALEQRKLLTRVESSDEVVLSCRKVVKNWYCHCRGFMSLSVFGRSTNLNVTRTR